MTFKEWIRKEFYLGEYVPASEPIIDVLERAWDAGVREGAERAADHIEGMELYADGAEGAKDVSAEIATEIRRL